MGRTSSSMGLSLLEDLEKLEIQPGLILCKGVELEFRFLKMFFCCLTRCDEVGKDSNLVSLLVSVKAIVKEIHNLSATNLESDCSSLLEKSEHLKPKISGTCCVMLDAPLRMKSCSSDEILEFIGCLVGNLKDFLKLKVDFVVSLKNQIRVLQERSSFLRNISDFAAKRCSEPQKLEGFLDYVNDWVHRAACLSLLCWLDGEEETAAQRLETMICNLLQKMKPCTPEAAGKFIAVLKASKPSRLEKLLVGQIVAAVADVFLEDLAISVKDYAEILREGLIFMITFLMNPSEDAVRNGGNELFTRVDGVTEEILFMACSLHISIGREISISSLRSKIDKVKAEVAEVYIQVPNSSDFGFPMTNGMGFVNFFMENLKKMLKCFPESIAFAKDQIASVKKHLVLLRPHLKDIMEVQILQNECEDQRSQALKDLWKRSINVVYGAEHAIASCSLVDHPIWYDLLCLANVIEEIKLINIQVLKLNDLIQNIRISSAKTSSRQLLPTQSTTSRLKEVVIGLKDESDKIIGRLTRGTTKLDVVSIVGMPGLGKTTLAKKVYNDPNVKHYFHKSAWCCVSQTYKIREIILDIMSEIYGYNARNSESNTSDEDLAGKLRKSLKGQKYIIVMDDVWDIEAWETIKLSFPDDSNGSRILFTTRIHNLFQQMKPNCSPDHPLRALSEEESWELLREKIFPGEYCPYPDLLETGKSIAKNCKGLPLAVVLTAGILSKRSKEIDWWKQIEKSTSAQIGNEGSMDVLELSYKHLPESLKSCFLYFGAFPEDRTIRARKLMSLWIAEGLIPRTEKKSLYEVAEDYLIDLIHRSLIIVAERSSKGGAKACRVHDLLRDLCLAKIQEDKFLHWVHNSDDKNYDTYRLCIDAEWKKFIDSNPSVPQVHSLILFGNYSAGTLYPYSSQFFNSFKLLNVLDLECIYLKCGFPEGVTTIIHLRYFAMSCQATELPSTIANLWNLETLILRSSAAEIPLPNTIWEMKSLSHVCIPSMCLTGLELHEDGNLEFMDYFSTPILNSGKETEELLRRLPGLRRLDCKFIERQFNNEPYKFPELSRLHSLESLKVFSYGPVLFGEKQDQFPAFDLPSSIRRLTLGRFSVPWKAVSVIAKLPNLEVLKLRARVFSGKIWDVKEGEFLKLKLLELWQLDIEQWSVPDDEPFPCLEKLVMKSCYNLEGIPASLGYIPTLNYIEMSWCYNASDSARQILEEQREMGNDGLQVIVLG